MTNHIHAWLVLEAGLEVCRGCAAHRIVAQEDFMERGTLTVSEAATYLGIGRNTAYELVAQGKLPVLRLGRRLVVPRRALEKMLAGNGDPPPVVQGPKMAKFRKRPIVIEAEQWWPDLFIPGVYEKTIWTLGDAPEKGGTDCDLHVWVTGAHVHTLEGPLSVSPGDWIITGVKGECYPCKPDVFDATYELVV